MTQFIAHYWLETALGIVGTTFAAGFHYLNGKIKQSVLEQKAVKNGIQALLRDRILAAYHAQKEMGHCPVYILEHVDVMYKQYVLLGGNGILKTLMEEMHHLAQKGGAHHG